MPTLISHLNKTEQRELFNDLNYLNLRGGTKRVLPVLMLAVRLDKGYLSVLQRWYLVEPGCSHQDSL